MPRPATGLNTVSRRLPDGTKEYRWYHRATGREIGKSTDGWTKAAAIARAKEMDEGETSGPPAGSFGALCVEYLKYLDRRKKKLSEKTKSEYRLHIDILREMWETVPVFGISRQTIRALLAVYEDRPWQGNAIVRTLRTVMNFGIKVLEMPGLVQNPASEIEMHETASRTQIWNDAQVEAFLAVARPRLRMAAALLLYTTQRPGDVLRLTRPMMFERDGRPWLRLRQQKTGELIDVPCHHRLIAAVAAYDAAAEDRSDDSLLLVSSPSGRTWAYRNFARAWDATRRRANWRIARQAIAAMGGLPQARKQRQAVKDAIRAAMLSDLQRRDLRRTGVVQMALAGATVPQIAAVTGWRIDYAQKIVDTYLPRRGDVALGGVERWEQSEKTVVALPATTGRHRRAS